MNGERAADPYSALRHVGYRRYLVGNFLANAGRQAFNVAIAWQIYQWTHSATALGLVGLVNVLPLFAFVLPAGALADRYERRKVIQRTTVVSAVLSIGLVLLVQFHAAVPAWPGLNWSLDGLRGIARFFERAPDAGATNFAHPVLPLIYLILFVQAILRVLSAPSRSAFVPLLVPAADLRNAITWMASSFELATVLGPALGGLLVASLGYASVYLLEVVAGCTFVALLAGVRPLVAPRPRDPNHGMLAGLAFIRHHPQILGALSLDLFAVLLGGATALLPIYADEVLHVGPAGLGWLRAAPAAGAVTMAFLSAHRASPRRPGLVMLWSVAGFGGAVGLFSYSTSVGLSLAALFLTGMCDNYSVVLRHSLVQLLTPDALRGRVSAVNQLFIGCSNEISTLRAGLMAALVGPVAAAGLGSLGIIAVVGLIAWLFPALRRVPPMHELQSAAAADDSGAAAGAK